MTLDEAIVSRMTNFAGLVALVANRVHPGKLPESGVYPAVSYLQVSGTPEVAMGADPGIGPRVYQLSAWDTGYASMRAVLAQVKLCWERFHGTVGGVVFQDAFIVNETTIWEPSGLLFQGVLDVELWTEG